MKKVFIDGKAGTTGLRIYERLADRADIELLTLSEAERKQPECRKKMLNMADIAFLCLPDEAAKESVAMTENPDTVIIDTSTAHRTNAQWAYGFPELSAAHEAALRTSKRIAVPGCHASGFIALVYPLVESGYLPKTAKLTCHSLTGYSGGGKKMIAQYEEGGEVLLTAPRQYGLSQTHKHLPEMQAVCGLQTTPIFCPIVSNFYSGMEVTVPLFASDLADGVTIEMIKAAYREKYNGDIVRYTDEADADGLLSAVALGGKDGMQVSVFGNEERILLTARYDNLGKGASGAAIEAMNMVLGTSPTKGLEI